MKFTKETMQHKFPGPVPDFHGRRLPETAIPAGYAALIAAFDVAAPIPHTLCAIGQKHKIHQADGWRLYTPRHAPQSSLEGHLTFALKYEGLDLCVLRRLFLKTGPDPIADIVRATPTGSYARRLWFLHEWLLGKRLDIPDAEMGSYVSVINPAHQYVNKGRLSRRHRVRDNLPGTPAFCPLAFRTEKLDGFMVRSLGERALETVAKIPKDVLTRTAALLLLKDSKSSYAIEGERPPHDRAERWGRAIGEAGRRPLDLDELIRLQRMVIGDARFVRMGLRNEGGFVGEHDRFNGAPIPAHISARHEDLPSLIDGLLAFANKCAEEAEGALDPVVAAAMLSFGFVYIHPFEDGNGRIHRYLFHHVLAKRGFNPSGVVFPVSSVMHDRSETYVQTLESLSGRMLPLVEWAPTDRNNITVLNETADYYRYFDATPHAEFMYECVETTILEDLPREAEFLRSYDRFRRDVNSLVDMPDRLIDLLFGFLSQNDGKLSRRAIGKEFSALAADEITAVEGFYADRFPGETGRVDHFTPNRSSDNPSSDAAMSDEKEI